MFIDKSQFTVIKVSVIIFLRIGIVGSGENTYRVSNAEIFVSEREREQKRRRTECLCTIACVNK